MLEYTKIYALLRWLYTSDDPPRTGDAPLLYVLLRYAYGSSGIPHCVLLVLRDICNPYRLGKCRHRARFRFLPFHDPSARAT